MDRITDTNSFETMSIQPNIYEINHTGVHDLKNFEPSQVTSESESLFMFDLRTSDRNEAIKWLLENNVDSNLCNLLLKPNEHIRFRYYNDYLYGELAYYSIDSEKQCYMAVINHGKTIYTIHEDDDALINRSQESIQWLKNEELQDLSIEYLLYLFIIEILSDYGELIIDYRDKIEELALNFDNRHEEVSPKDFLDAKTQLSNFSRVIEKIEFTLSFPPTRDMITKGDKQRVYFRDLQKNLDLVKISLEQTEDRVDSLNDHWQLLLQKKSNRRLKFLTIVQAVFVPMSLIAGIYGMNFDYIPLLELKYGYFYSIGIMLISAILFLWYFYKNDWFK